MLSFKHKVNTLKHIIHTQLDVDIESPEGTKILLRQDLFSSIYLGQKNMDWLKLVRVSEEITPQFCTV